jgi:hypothetical protein
MFIYHQIKTFLQSIKAKSSTNLFALQGQHNPLHMTSKIEYSNFGFLGYFLKYLLAMFKI